MNLTQYEDVAVDPNSSTTINLLNVDTGRGYSSKFFYVKTIVFREISPETGSIVLKPLPPSVTWSINPGTAGLMIMNGTAELVNVSVIYAVEISWVAIG
jgi:hypothetical protein